MINIDEELDLLFNENLDILNEDEDTPNTEEGSEGENNETSNEEETTEEQQDDNAEENAEEETDEENPETAENENSEGEPPPDGGEENAEEASQEPSEEELQAKEEELENSKEKYRYFIAFQDLYKDVKFFIDKLEDIIDKTNDDSETEKTILRNIFFKLYELKEDFEYLLLEKIDVLESEKLSTLYISLQSKTTILLELVEKISGNKDNN